MQISALHQKDTQRIKQMVDQVDLTGDLSAITAGSMGTKGIDVDKK